MSGSDDSLSACSSASPHIERVLLQTPEFEAVHTPALVQQLSVLKAQVATVQSQLQDNEDLIQAKNDENQELSEKLRALELAVQCLDETSKSNGVGCCSSACLVF